jgi:hypothetical protein
MAREFSITKALLLGGASGAATGILATAALPLWPAGTDHLAFDICPFLIFGFAAWPYPAFLFYPTVIVLNALLYALTLAVVTALAMACHYLASRFKRKNEVVQ